jgi:hypothetical protein
MGWRAQLVSKDKVLNGLTVLGSMMTVIQSRSFAMR